MRTARTLREPDYFLLFSFGLLVLFGLIMLTSASAPLGYGQFGDKYFFVKRQVLFGIIPGLISCFILMRIRPPLLKRLGPVAYIIAMLLLALIYVPSLGSTLGTGSRSWLVLGSFSLQPAEFAKIGLILFFASLIDRHLRDITILRTGFFPALLFGLVPVVMVVLQPDIGSGAVLFGILFVLLYVAGAKLRHMGIVLLCSSIVFIILVVIAPYRAERLTSFLHPELDPTGIGYQVNQAELAVGSGGLFGLGYGHSRQKFEYLPEVHGDSIFAVIGEEMGFVFVAGLILVYSIIALRSIHLAKSIDDIYGRLVIIGVIAWFVIQAFLNIGGIIGVVPLTGVPLPFISHGGTAILTQLIGVGVVMSVSRLRIR